jgi:HEAT repeat protein
MMRYRVFALAGGVLALATFYGRGVDAQAPAPTPRAAAGKPKVAAPQAPVFTVSPALTQKLRSGDELQVRAALDEVRVAGKGAQAAAPAVAEALQRGLSLSLTEAALETLGDIEADTASPAIALYSHHRSPTVRRAAVKALAKTKGATAVKTLRHALSDGDAMVRGFAATGLGAIKAKEAVGDLFQALDHQVPEAAAAIGQVCAPQECDQLAAKLGRLPFDIVTGGLDQVLFRPPAEVNDDQKVKVVGKLRELGTQEAHKYLTDVQKRWPEGWSSRVRQSIDQGVLATAGGSK